jgi:hypothetical protein
MKRGPLFFLIAAALSSAACCLPAYADGEIPCWSGRAGGYQVAVFQAPSTLRVGRGHLGLLVQDAATHAWLPTARATLRFAPHDRSQQIHGAEFSADASDNRLLQAATIELPEPGLWDFDISIAGPLGPASVRVMAEVAPAPASWIQLWPWWSLPAAVIALFAAHQALVARGEKRGVLRAKRAALAALPGGR